MSDEVNKTESENEIPNPKDEESDVLSKIKSMFGEEICNAFEREEITTESTLADLILRDADAPIFTRLGLNYGRTLRLQKEFSHLSKQNKRHPHVLGNSPSSKPSLVDLSQMSSEMKQLYYVKRKKIGTHVAKTWGKNLPIFNTPEAKAELEALAESLEPECGIKEINFGADGIAQHIKNFCYEQRRYEKGRKRQHVEPSPTPKAPGKHKKTKSSAKSPTRRGSVPFKMAANEEDNIKFSQNVSDETDNGQNRTLVFGLSQTGGPGQNVSSEEFNHHIKTYTNVPSHGDDSQTVDSKKNNNFECVEIQTPENKKNNNENQHCSSTKNSQPELQEESHKLYEKEPTNKAQGITKPPLNDDYKLDLEKLDHEDPDRTAAGSGDTSLEPLVGSSQLNDREQLIESGENITKEKVQNNKPQEKIPTPQIIKELLQKTHENLRDLDDIVPCDCIGMNGMIGESYTHYAIVETYVDGDKVTVTEYGKRDCNSLLLFLMTIVMVIFNDPLAMFAKAKKSTYSLQQLKDRKAKKIIFPEELQRYINRDKTLKNTEKRRKEPDFLYSLSMNNCEHLVWWCLFDLEYSYQASESHKWVLEGIKMAVQLLFKLAIAIKWPYISIAWLSVIHELCLVAGYDSYQAHRLKKLNFNNDANYKNQMCVIWGKALIIIMMIIIIVHIYT